MKKLEEKVDKDDDGVRLDRWFKSYQPQFTNSLLQKMLRKKDIRVNGKRSEANYRLNDGDKITFPEIKQDVGNRDDTQINEVSPRNIERFMSWVIYENNDYLVINKPNGLASQGGTGIKISVDDIIKQISPRYKLVHRLDKDTSGVLVIAKKTTAARKFGELLQEKKIEKIYHALVKGVLKKKGGKIDLPLMKTGLKVEVVSADNKDGKEALSEYQVVETLGDKLSWLELKPITGRTHQLRVHCAEIGHPIIGDGKYGGKVVFEDGLSDKLHLHAYRIIIPELDIDVSAELPPHMRDM